MFGQKKYIFNEETQSYEIYRRPVRERVMRAVLTLLAGLACFCIYHFLFTRVLGFKSPKTAILEARHQSLSSAMELLGDEITAQNSLLLELQNRDEIVYRPVFGMDTIAGCDRALPFTPEQSFKERLDLLSGWADARHASFTAIGLLASRVGDMASCVPSIAPALPSHISLSSTFGVRFHPIKKEAVFHEGIDLSGQEGEPVYVTGDGVVVSSEFNITGYGNCVVVDHGFGYKTRYAHLQKVLVSNGQKLVRGDQIGTLGSTGMATGPHIHYEVVYRGQKVNPWNFFNPDMPDSEYSNLVRQPDGQEGR